MRLSEIGDKEIVDIVKGSMHGKLWDAEMLFDEATGAISFLLVPYFNGSGHKFSSEIQLPWDSIVVIGEDMIIFKST